MAPPKFTPPSPIEQPELVFAMIGPTGTDLDGVTEALEAELKIVGYTLVEPIRLSRLLQGLPEHEHLRELTGPEDERLRAHMNAGDEVRRSFGHGGALAALAVAELRRVRGRDEARPGTAYLLRSLKHPQEVELLRAIYGTSLIVISVFEAEESRAKRVSLRIAASRGTQDGAREAASALLRRDQEGGDDPDYGQSVRKAFPLADFFLDATHDLRGGVERLVHLLFGHPHMSPSRDEYAMFMAQAAALRSADLSRQVGAVIVDGDGELLATGCNEVPKPGGGVYWSDDKPDHRDFQHGADPNALMGREVLHEVFRELRNSGWLATDKADKEPATLVALARQSKIFEGARVDNLVEFGRVVHAEMNALMHAARRGIAVGKGHLYCTTFPCHGCARHIIAAGLASVVYVEPYPKSLALELYPEAISLRGDERAVAFRAFTGVAPRRYLDFFGHGRRKDALGFALKWTPRMARPRSRQLANPHLLAETDLCVTLSAALRARTPL